MLLKHQIKKKINPKTQISYVCTRENISHLKQMHSIQYGIKKEQEIKSSNHVVSHFSHVNTHNISHWLISNTFMFLRYESIGINGVIITIIFFIRKILYGIDTHTKFTTFITKFTPLKIKKKRYKIKSSYSSAGTLCNAIQNFKTSFENENSYTNKIVSF